MKSAGNDIVALNCIDRERTGQARFYSRFVLPSEQALYRCGRFAELPFEHFVWLAWSVKESVFKYQKRIAGDLVFAPWKILVEELVCGGDGVKLAGEGGAEGDAGKLAGAGAGAAGSLEARAGDFGEMVYRGRAVLGEAGFYFRSVVCDDFIATMVSDEEDLRNMEWGVRRIGDEAGKEVGHAVQSIEVRALVLERLEALGGDGGQDGEDAGDVMDGGDRGDGGNAGDDEESGDAGRLHIEKNSSGCPVVFRGGREIGIPVSLAHHGRYIGYSLRLGSG